MSACAQNPITGRLSLRPPQADSLARLKLALDAGLNNARSRWA